MNSTKIKILTSIWLLSFNLIKLFAQEEKFVNDFIVRLENSQKYLNLVAEMMPKEKYDYKVTPESLSFAENLMHIGYALDWHSQSLLGGREARTWQTDTIYKTHNKNKKEMLVVINNTFEKAIVLLNDFDTAQLDDKLDYFGLDRSKRQIFMLLADHITHHRGQMLVHLRLNGLVPPRYVLYQ
ncbi:DinB family protein [uncultured Croceitalea sp.]|uniref:DinB family protein n=1 Tax=uncultured Croceitalea sp. TaxID=1798908 RepID=UPI003305E4CB